MLGAFFGLEVDLEEGADGMGALAGVTEGLDAVGVSEHEADDAVAGFPHEAAADSGMPGVGVFEAWEVFDIADGAEDEPAPAAGGIEAECVPPGEEGEPFGAQFLEVVTWEVEGELGDEGEGAADAVGAEAVRVDVEAHGQAEAEVLTGFVDGVVEQGTSPDEVTLGLDRAITSVAVGAAFASELSLVPGGEFHAEIGEHDRLDAPPPQADPEEEVLAVLGHFEAWGGGIVGFVEGEVTAGADDGVEGDEPVGVEEVVEGDGGVAAVAGEGLFAVEVAEADFGVGVGESAAGDPEGEVGLGPEGAAEAEFGIEVNGGDRDAEGEVGADPLRSVHVVEGIGGEGATAFEGLVVADLDEVTRDRIDLAEAGAGGQEGGQ